MARNRTGEAVIAEYKAAYDKLVTQAAQSNYTLEEIVFKVACIHDVVVGQRVATAVHALRAKQPPTVFIAA